MVKSNAAPRAPEPGDVEELEAELREAARIEPTCIDEEFVRLPTDIAWWTARHARAIGVHLTAEAKAKRLRGFLEIDARRRLEDLARLKLEAERDPDAKKQKREQRITEAMVAAEVEQDPRWHEAQADEIAAEVERERMKGAVAAMMAKRDALIQLGANARAEMQHDPVIRDTARVGRR